MLFSGGKDSIVMARLAEKAFRPAGFRFPLLHIDSGHNFEETIRLRDDLVRHLQCDLVVRSVAESIAMGRVQPESGPNPSNNALQTVTLLDALIELRADAAIGGGRRDEEKARSKERFFSHRGGLGQWNPSAQRPELWNILNGRKAGGEHFRVYPLSNWTEEDVWRYIAAEGLTVPSLYFSHERDVIDRDGILLAALPENIPPGGSEVQRRRVRCRTVGDVTCTGFFDSYAGTVEEVLSELSVARFSERGQRHDDRRSESALEDRKRTGYF
ncbi:MAG: sulfate adenylyltransferase subunit 2 [Rhodothermales bacterium]|jgi:sulfate adenylyltransferase subunit 2